MREVLRHWKWVRLKAWILRIFRPSDSAVDIHDFVVNNPTFYNIQIGPDQVASEMKVLSERAIDGAEYDSSVRDPPPSCHPGTRIELLGRITTWFYNKKREKALLWLSGPAGVGKSAVIQTFAESLAETGSLGATLFFSRLNDRNDPQRVIATISFQLAMRIPAYREYVAQKISLDPSLLKKAMKDQFQALIVEPFGNQGIGEKGGPWGIFLDGLDECEGADQQCEIVRLVGEFVLKFPNSSLVWSISSRPEPHIVTAFASSTIAPSHWSEYVPINSTEGCKDVERYLNKNFERMRNEFPHVPRNWPKEIQFLKLTNGALGLFVFAKTAVRFMEDRDHADPVSRLDLLLSVIDHLDIAVMDEHPFALLDALYSHILKSIPSTLWPVTKRILGFFICVRSPNEYTCDGLSYPLMSCNLAAASIILCIKEHVVYSSLHKLHSVLKIPRPDDSYMFGVSFLHASFGDYLTDRLRSGDFWIDRGECVDDITDSLVRLHYKSPNIHFNKNGLILLFDTQMGQFHGVTGNLRSDRGRGPFIHEEDLSECLNLLEKTVVSPLLSNGCCGYDFVEWLFELWRMFPHELKRRGLVRELPLRDVRVDHLQNTAHIDMVLSGVVKQNIFTYTATLKEFAADFHRLQEDHLDTVALIYGATPHTGMAFIPSDMIKYEGVNWQGYYYFPYP